MVLDHSAYAAASAAACVPAVWETVIEGLPAALNRWVLAPDSDAGLRGILGLIDDDAEAMRLNGHATLRDMIRSAIPVSELHLEFGAGRAVN